VGNNNILIGVFRGGEEISPGGTFLGTNNFCGSKKNVTKNQNVGVVFLTATMLYYSH